MKCRNCGMAINGHGNLGFCALCRGVREAQRLEKRRQLRTASCAECGKEFHPSGPKVKCCTLSCAMRLSHREKHPPKFHTCEVCGTNFRHQSRSHNRACSRECGYELQRCEWKERSIAAATRSLEVKIKKSQPIEKKCVICNLPFAAPANNTKTVCSDRCEKVRSLRWARERDERADKRDRSERSCPECGITFIPVYGSGLRIFCSIRCGNRCASRTNNTNRRIKKAKYSHRASKVFPAAVFARSNGRCGICNELMATNVGPHHPLRQTIDHRVPICKGGEHVLENCWAVHFICNSLKGQDSVTPELVCACRNAIALSRQGVTSGFKRPERIDIDKNAIASI